ncbi:MAG TPA: hypothetical protein VNM16_10260 [Bacillota bacterium]|nr:hypothetical protein [Bacillota bacterium]
MIPPTALNQISGLQRRARQATPPSPVAFAAASSAAPAGFAEVLAAVLGRPLQPRELQIVRRHWQRYGPFDPQIWLPVLTHFVAQKGAGHHIAVYLDLCRAEAVLR